MLCDYTAGLFAGFVSVLLGHPFDTIKTQQQLRNITVSEATSRIKEFRGWRGFFRGMTAPLVATGTLNAIFFGIYGDLRDYLVARRIDSIEYWTLRDAMHAAKLVSEEEHLKIKSKVDKIRQATWGELFISGTVAGMVTITISAPVELAKTKLQSQMKRTMFKGPIHCMTTITRDAGIRGLYRGFIPLAFRDGIGGGAYFIAYEGCKEIIKNVYGPTSSAIEPIIAGGMAGMTNWALILPFDTIKTRMQGDDHKKPHYKNMRHVITEILKKDGMIGLYRGFWSVSARAFPVNASIFLVYEVLQSKLCNRLL